MAYDCSSKDSTRWDQGEAALRYAGRSVSTSLLLTPLCSSTPLRLTLRSPSFSSPFGCNYTRYISGPRRTSSPWIYINFWPSLPHPVSSAITFAIMSSKHSILRLLPESELLQRTSQEDPGPTLASAPDAARQVPRYDPTRPLRSHHTQEPSK